MKRMPLVPLALAALIGLIAPAPPPAAAQAGEATMLLRFPDIHGDRVVFTYGGDLWLAAAGGGTARRLTAHPGEELFPRFSPDGTLIAFTGQYDGDEQVYVLPAAGGEPRQLTYYPARGPLPPRWGYDHQVLGWAPDGSAVLFRSLRGGWDLSDARLYLASLDGGLPTPLPPPEAGGAELSPDGSKLVYSPLARDFRTWKRYQGGWAQELYIFDLASHGLTRVTDHPRADRDPMWIGEKIYFNSDRGGTFDLYVHDPAGGTTERLTDAAPWDVRWPASDGEGRIVFELGGELAVLDLASGEVSELAIHVPDDGLWRRPRRVSASEDVEDFGLSPDGKRALFTARGDLFTVPIEHGPTRNLTRSSGAHDKWAAWSPDGSRVVFISDRDGEEEIYVVDQEGRGAPEQLTDGGSAMRYRPLWSPDGERLAFSDKDGRVYVLTIADRGLVEIARNSTGTTTDYAWSPDGGHLALALGGENTFSSIYIWSAAGGQLRRVTDEMWNDFSPAWDPGGEYLYYLSDRQFAPQVGSFEWNYAVDRESEILALALRRDVPHPFPAESDEVEVAAPGKRAQGDEEEDDEDEEDERVLPGETLRIDFDGLGRRVARVPVEADNYGSLTATSGHLLYLRNAPFYYGREADLQPALMLFSREDREAETLAENVSGYALSFDGEYALAAEDGAYHRYEVDSDDDDHDREPFSTAGLELTRVPEEEWAQIFDEVWRRFRDFFYVENMHGYDWQALGERYRELLPHVAHRSDLNYILGEMVAELNVSHAYVSGGDLRPPERPAVALPGARLELDAEAGRYRFAEIYRGHNEEAKYRAPLAEIGVEVAEGDYLLAIDGEEVGAGDNPYRLLRYKGEHPVEITVSADAGGAGARRVTFEPVRQEAPLRYLAWVESRRALVEELSGGRAGYLHIPDMSSNGIYEFIKWFYGQVRKEGLVVDVRNNGGGNVSEMILERLRRQLLGVTFVRTAEVVDTYPSVVFTGPMVCVLDEDSASDGDIFPYMFRHAGLGPLIGKRSWGGIIGITSRGPLIDGGDVRVPEFGNAGADGSWIIEGYGVDPDIVVDNPPAAVLAGRDPQLERAVEEVLKRMEDHPAALPSRPPAPVKTP